MHMHQPHGPVGGLLLVHQTRTLDRVDDGTRRHIAPERAPRQSGVLRRQIGRALIALGSWLDPNAGRVATARG